MLEVKDLHAAYDGKAALHGLDFKVEAGGCVCLIGANGAGKTHDDALPRRPDASSARRDHVRGPRDFGAAAGAPGRRRYRLGARGPARVRADDGAREPRDGRVSPAVAAARPRRRRRSRLRVRPVSAASRTRGAARRRSLGRRAADAGDRPRADGAAASPPARRAVDGARAAGGQEHLCDAAPAQ